MKGYIFRVDGKRHYARLLFYIAVGLPFCWFLWLSWQRTGSWSELFYLIPVAGCVACLIVLLFVPRPGLRIDTTGLRYGRCRVSFDQVDDLTIQPPVYIFYTRSRRSIKLDLKEFSRPDRLAVDALMREALGRIFAEAGPQEEQQPDRFDFDVTEQHSRVFYPFFVLLSAALVMYILIFILFLFLIPLDELIALTEPLWFVPVISGWLACLASEKIDRKHRFIYRDGIFRLYKGDRQKIAFTAEDVWRVESDPRYNRHFTFHLRGGGKARVMLRFFCRREDKKLLVNKIKSIFYLTGK